MGFKSLLSIPFANWIMRSVRKNAANAIECQDRQFSNLVAQGKKTAFGKDHDFENIRTVSDFRQRVPIADYEHLKPYIERVIDGEHDVLWPKQPIYFCKTSGTTSGVKYIPITADSMPNHINSARNALLAYIAEGGNPNFVDGKMIFLQGSPQLDYLKSGIPYGRLSGIVAHHVPAYLQRNRLPSMEANSIEDWESKLEAIVAETKDEKMTLISGIPAWVQMYFEQLIEATGKPNVRAIFPNFSLFVFGGVNFAPYRARFRELIGDDVAVIETYPASEGFIAYQDGQNVEGLLLTVNDGIWYEFVPADRYFDADPPRLTLREVEIGVNYALILNTNAGLWGYSIGDTVKFVSLKPPRIVVTGRIKHFTSAFGEHVIAEEVEKALTEAITEHPCQIREFHVAPQVNPVDGLPYHEWLIEFESHPADQAAFAQTIDAAMCRQNIYYRDLITGHILREVVITPLPKGSFEHMMKKRGKLGGQNKVPRLANDREVADVLRELL